MFYHPPISSHTEHYLGSCWKIRIGDRSDVPQSQNLLWMYNSTLCEPTSFECNASIQVALTISAPACSSAYAISDSRNLFKSTDWDSSRKTSAVFRTLKRNWNGALGSLVLVILSCIFLARRWTWIKLPYPPGPPDKKDLGLHVQNFDDSRWL